MIMLLGMLLLLAIATPEKAGKLPRGHRGRSLGKSSPRAFSKLDPFSKGSTTSKGRRNRRLLYD